MTTEKTLQQFIEEHGLTMEAKFVEQSKDAEGWDHFAWSVKVRSKLNSREYATDYRMGLAHQSWDAKAYDLPPGEKAGERVKRTGPHGITLHTEAQLKRWARPTAPTIDEVLDSLRSDAESIENAPLFEDWASEMGYDTDSRKAEKVFHACQEVRGHLIRLLGKAAYEDLVANVERL